MNNKESFLRAFHSCAQQIYRPFEIVIIQDSYPDSTIEMTLTMLHEEPMTPEEREQLLNLKIIEVPKCFSPGLLRNFGIFNAKGRYLCFVSDDGELDTLFLEIMMNAINNREVETPDIVFCDYMEEKNGEMFNYHINHILAPEEISSIREKTYPVNLPSGCFLIKKELIELNPWSISLNIPNLTNQVLSSIFREMCKKKHEPTMLYTHYKKNNSFSNKILNKFNLTVEVSG
jgi:glycosyltransferase involved in cell wall biosynthesis